MVRIDSPLRRLPQNLAPKQALFFDGMRHAAEIAQLAYSRLQRTLTLLAYSESLPQSHSITAAYLDAWAFIDATDRFRHLWIMQPSAERAPLSANGQSVNEELENVKLVRDVGDHIAQKIEQVLALKAPVLGKIEWTTFISDELAMMCVLVPGTVRKSKNDFVFPDWSAIEKPTGCIVLKAGNKTANLSDAHFSLAGRVRQIEANLEQWIQDNNLQDSSSGADIVSKFTIDTNLNSVIEGTAQLCSPWAASASSGRDTP